MKKKRKKKLLHLLQATIELIRHSLEQGVSYYKLIYKSTKKEIAYKFTAKAPLITKIYRA